jgi:hypothetical protein
MTRLQSALVGAFGSCPGDASQAQIKPLTGEGAEIVVSAVRISAADTGYTLPVSAAGEKVLAGRLDPFEAKPPECIGILLIIQAAEINE